MVTRTISSLLQTVHHVHSEQNFPACNYNCRTPRHRLRWWHL